MAHLKPNSWPRLDTYHIGLERHLFRYQSATDVLIQEALLNGIMVNGIIWSMESNWNRFTSLLYLMDVSSSFAYCYNSVNVISFSMAQSDPIKQHLQYCRCDLEYSIRYFNIITNKLFWLLMMPGCGWNHNFIVDGAKFPK